MMKIRLSILLLASLIAFACQPRHRDALPALLQAEARLSSEYFTSDMSLAHDALKRYISETDTFLSNTTKPEEIEAIRTGRSLAIARLSYIDSPSKPDLSIAIKEMRLAGARYSSESESSIETLIRSIVSSDKVPWIQNEK
jgi:hypothetical protein